MTLCYYLFGRVLILQTPVSLYKCVSICIITCYTHVFNTYIMYTHIRICMGNAVMGAPTCTLALTPTSHELTPT